MKPISSQFTTGIVADTLEAIASKLAMFSKPESSCWAESMEVGRPMAAAESNAASSDIVKIGLDKRGGGEFGQSRIQAGEC